MHFVEAKGILSAKNGMNIYRGCTHGCIYCDSRSVCYQMRHDFEDVEVKRNAPELLEASLRSKRRKCMIGTGAMSDPYMHCEETLGLTRRCVKSSRVGFGLAHPDQIRPHFSGHRSAGTHHGSKVRRTDDAAPPATSRLRILEPRVCETRRDTRHPGVSERASRRWSALPFSPNSTTPWRTRGLLAYCSNAGVQGIFSPLEWRNAEGGGIGNTFMPHSRHFPGLKDQYIRRYGSAYQCMSDRM